jgi:hypothetical protein
MGRHDVASGFSRTGLLAVAGCVVAASLVLSAQPPRCDACVWGRYWPIPTTGCRTSGVPCFPETDSLPDGPSLGVAFSGGGTRSATMVLGELRGLKKIGVLDQVRYVSAISGGGWASVPFVYTKSTLDSFLGPFQVLTPDLPDDKRLDFLEHPVGELGLAVVNSSFTAGSIQEVAGDLASNFSNQIGDQMWLALTSSINGAIRREPDRVNKTYARLIGKIFVDPLIDPGTDASKRLYSWNSLTVEDTSLVSRGQLGNDLVVTGPHRPFLIAGGTVIVSRRDSGYPLLMPIEYTPMYVGIRHRFSPRYGGVYVSPWMYDTTQIGDARDDGANHLLSVRRDPDRAFTLGDVVGSTGAAPQLALVLGTGVPASFRDRVQRFSEVFPAFRHVTLNDGPGRNVVTEEIGHGDGGFGDNLGIMPLLARGVKNILVFSNTVTKLAENNDDIKSLFFPIGPPDSGGDKTANRVFWCSDEREDGCTPGETNTYYKTLMDGLAARRDAGKAQVFCAGPWKVRANEHYGVAAMESGVNICWFYTSTSSAWEATLPAQFRDMVHGVDKTKYGKNFDDFPWLKTFGQNKTHVIQLTAPQVNLLSNLTAWIVSDEEQAIRRTLLQGR